MAFSKEEAEAFVKEVVAFAQKEGLISSLEECSRPAFYFVDIENNYGLSVAVPAKPMEVIKLLLRVAEKYDLEFGWWIPVGDSWEDYFCFCFFSRNEAPGTVEVTTCTWSLWKEIGLIDWVTEQVNKMKTENNLSDEEILLVKRFEYYWQRVMHPWLRE